MFDDKIYIRLNKELRTALRRIPPGKLSCLIRAFLFHVAFQIETNPKFLEKIQEEWDDIKMRTVRKKDELIYDSIKIVRHTLLYGNRERTRMKSNFPPELHGVLDKLFDKKVDNAKKLTEILDEGKNWQPLDIFQITGFQPKKRDEDRD